MKITIFLFIVGFCLISAKYLPYETSGSDVLLRSKRSDSDDSSSSVEHNKSGSETDNDDDSDDNNDSNDSVEKKIKEAELKRKEKEEKEKRKFLEKQEKEKCKKEEEQRKLEEKQAKEQRKEEEKREKEEHKRLERIEKEKRKEEEKEKKLLEKREKEEKKKQEKQRKDLEKLEKETLQNETEENDFLETEEDSSVELEDIWKSHIYAKYGLTFASTKLEKQAALNRYLKEELGLNSNSTENERYQAIAKLIQTKLQTDAAERDAIRTQFLNHVNALSIQKLRSDLEKDLEELNNKTEILNNVILPWVPVAQQQIDERISVLQTISQFLSNILPNWVIGEGKNSTEQNLNSINNPTGIVSTGTEANIISESNVNDENVQNTIITKPAENDVIGNAAGAINSVTKDTTSQGAVISDTVSSAVETAQNTNENKPSDANKTPLVSGANNNNAGITTGNSVPAGNNNVNGNTISAINDSNDPISKGTILSQSSTSMSGNNPNPESKVGTEIPSDESNVILGASGDTVSKTVSNDVVSTDNRVPSQNSISKSSGSESTAVGSNNESITNDNTSGVLSSGSSGADKGSTVGTSSSSDGEIAAIGNDNIVSGIQTINVPNPTPDSILPITVDVAPVKSANIDTVNVVTNTSPSESNDVAAIIPSIQENDLNVASVPITNNGENIVPISDMSNSDPQLSLDATSESNNVPSSDSVNNNSIINSSGIKNVSPVSPDAVAVDNVNSIITDVTGNTLPDSPDIAVPVSSNAATVDISEANYKQQETVNGLPTIPDASDLNVIKTNAVDIPSPITSQSVPEADNIPFIDGNLADNTDLNSNVNENAIPTISVSNANVDQAAVSSISIPNNSIPVIINDSLNSPVDIVSGIEEVPSGSVAVQESAAKVESSSSSTNIPSINITEEIVPVSKSDAIDSSNGVLDANENSLSEIVNNANNANLAPATENVASNLNPDTVSENTAGNVLPDLAGNALAENTDTVTSSPVVITGDTIAPEVIKSSPEQNVEINLASTGSPLVDSEIVKDVTTISGTDINAEPNVPSEPLQTNESSPVEKVFPEVDTTPLQVGDGVTIPIEPGASVVEIVAQ